MASTFEAKYGTRTQVLLAAFLEGLANGDTATSAAIDNSVTLFQDFIIEFLIDGTAAATAWLDVRILPSMDNSNFATWESGIPLGTIPLAVDLQKAFFSMVANSFLLPPKYFKIAVKNNTGAALNAGAGTSWAYYTGLNNQSV